jgi:type VI secretion system protein ImpK
MTDVFETRPENLAAVFQEVLTATVRLRSNRQSVSDAATFRSQVKEALRIAEQEGRKRGYSGDTLRLALFAAVSFIDESVLNLQSPAFADWVRKPLQEEMFGVHVAGEMFFENLRRLLSQPDSSELSDLLELHQLCLLLGFRGRYGSGSHGEVRSVLDAITDKIRRARGISNDLSPAWALPKSEPLPTHDDPWRRRLVYVALGCAALALVLFIGFSFALSSGVTELRALAAEGSR